MLPTGLRKQVAAALPPLLNGVKLDDVLAAIEAALDEYKQNPDSKFDLWVDDESSPWWCTRRHRPRGTSGRKGGHSAGQPPQTARLALLTRLDNIKRRATGKGLLRGTPKEKGRKHLAGPYDGPKDKRDPLVELCMKLIGRATLVVNGEWRSTQVSYPTRLLRKAKQANKRPTA